jgi:hypothetical protein
MNEEYRLMMHIWLALTDYIPAGAKQEAADDLVDSFVEHGIPIGELYDAEGECPYIDRALATAAEAAAEEEEPVDGEDEDWLA